MLRNDVTFNELKTFEYQLNTHQQLAHVRLLLHDPQMIARKQFKYLFKCIKLEFHFKTLFCLQRLVQMKKKSFKYNPDYRAVVCEIFSPKLDFFFGE